MKLLSITGLMALSFASFANPQMMGMDPAQMQKMVAEMQSCMQNIDMNELEKLKTRGEAMKAEIQSLCSSGKRDAATNKAIAYSKEMMSAPGLVQIKKCSETARDMMPNMQNFEQFNPDNYKDSHVCDNMK